MNRWVRSFLLVIGLKFRVMYFFSLKHSELSYSNSGTAQRTFSETTCEKISA